MHIVWTYIYSWSSVLFISKSYLYTIIFIINNKLWWLYLSFHFLSDIKVVASLENLWWLRCNINCDIGHIFYWWEASGFLFDVYPYNQNTAKQNFKKTKDLLNNMRHQIFSFDLLWVQCRVWKGWAPNEICKVIMHKSLTYIMVLPVITSPRYIL